MFTHKPYNFPITHIFTKYEAIIVFADPELIFKINLNHNYIDYSRYEI